MIHDARIIPLDNRPRSARMQSWMGEPRGRWEGDTLVVETMNYNNKGWITTSMASGRIKGIPHSDKLHVIERFTRVSKDVISYSATIEDPEMYTRPVDDLVSAQRLIPNTASTSTRATRQLRDREHPQGRPGAGEGRDEITEVRPGPATQTKAASCLRQ
jgi:hypothetical protein